MSSVCGAFIPPSPFGKSANRVNAESSSHQTTRVYSKTGRDGGFGAPNRNPRSFALMRMDMIMNPSEPDSIKLNLGAGAQKFAGFTTVDLANNWTSIQPDVVADVTGQLPFPDDHADEVHAYHVFEHIYRWKVEDVLKEWIRVLKPGGLLVLEMPCLDKVLDIFIHFAEAKKPAPIQLTMWGLFGDPRYKNEAMCHRWCYSASELYDLLEYAGQQEITEETPKTHQPVRDMRMVSRKPFSAVS